MTDRRILDLNLGRLCVNTIGNICTKTEVHGAKHLDVCRSHEIRKCVANCCATITS